MLLWLASSRGRTSGKALLQKSVHKAKYDCSLLFSFNKTLKANSWITVWLVVILTVSDTCWNNGYRLPKEEAKRCHEISWWWGVAEECVTVGTPELPWGTAGKKVKQPLGTTCHPQNYTHHLVFCFVFSLALYFYISNRISAQMIEFDSMCFSSSCFRSQSTLYKICYQKWHCLDICTALYWCSMCSHWAAAGLERPSAPALSTHLCFKCL